MIDMTRFEPGVRVRVRKAHNVPATAGRTGTVVRVDAEDDPRARDERGLRLGRELPTRFIYVQVDGWHEVPYWPEWLEVLP